MEAKDMKSKIAYSMVLGSVLIILVSSYVAAIGSEDIRSYDTGDQDRESGDVLFEDEFALEGDVNGDEKLSSFNGFLDRIYQEVSRDFNVRNSGWERLPWAKEGLVSEEPGRWMIEKLEELGDEYEIDITDEDGDGIPERVVVVFETGEEEVDIQLPEHLIEEDRTEIINRGIERLSQNGIWELIYLDDDDDGMPGYIFLNVSVRYFLIQEEGGVDTVSAGHFLWKGLSRDIDDDGDWDVQRYSFHMRFVVDPNHDSRPELVSVHKASYARLDVTGSDEWNLIIGTSTRGHVLDRNTDGNPESISRTSESFVWRDGNDDQLPGKSYLRFASSTAKDADSDGNKEETDSRMLRFSYLDKDEDTNPELVRISYQRKITLDRDDDGRPDMIRIVSRKILWIDRDSDGIPEMNRRTIDENTMRPGDTKRDRDGIIRNVMRRIRERVGGRGERSNPRDIRDDAERNKPQDPFGNP
jgi:hypothetical protein